MKLLINLRKLKNKIRYDYKINIKKSLKQANESNIKFAIIIGESEVNNNTYTIKNLHNGSQKNVSFDNLLKILKS